MSVAYDLRPDQSPSAVIEASRATQLSWLKALQEFIDNSCDFGARRVTISFGKDWVEIDDDGEGCADPSYLLSPGKHGMPRNGRPRIGRYGVGGKEASMSLADEIFVSSCCEGMRREVRVIYDHLIRRNSWVVEGEDPRPDNKPSGVHIRLTRLRKNSPDYRALLAGLGAAYGPGIRQGEIQIIVHTPRSREGALVRAMPDPPMDSMKSATVELSRGRVLEMHAGIITEPAHRVRAGTWLAYGYRVILQSRLGLPSRPTPGLYVFCQMSGPAKTWSLQRHKGGVWERDQDDISEAIQQEFGDIIALAERRGEDIEISQVNSVLGGIQHAAREILRREVKRKNPPTEVNEGKDKKGKGLRPYRPHSREMNMQPGRKALLACIGQNGFQLSREERAPSDDLMTMQGHSIVVLNTAHPAYAAHGSQVGDWWGLAATLFFAQHAGEWKEILIKELRQESFEHIVSVLLQSYLELRFDRSGQSAEVG
jgi:hypothetical protein